MAAITQWFEQDLQKPVIVNYSRSTAFSTDNNSLVVGVRVYDDGAAAALSGNVVCHVIRDADGGTVTFNGTLSGNSVSATLPAACFAYVGPIAVMLQLVSGTTKTTLLKTVYNVVQGSTDTPIDPGSVVPNIDDLLAQISRMEQATDAAEAAAAKSVRYDESQALTDAQKAQALANIGGASTAEVADLKSSSDIINKDLSSGRVNYYNATYLAGLAEDFYNIDNSVTWEQGSWTASGDVDSNFWIRTPSNNKLLGGFLVHNKDTRYGIFVAKYNATTGEWAGYYVSTINASEYIYVPAERNILYKLRVRLVASNASPLSPEDNMIDIYRCLNTGILNLPSIQKRALNSPSFVGIAGSDYGNLFANVTGTDNIITNIAASQWTDVPFGGCGINQRYTTNYDVQIIFSLTTKAIAYRFVTRSNKTPYNDWQILMGGNSLYGKTVSIIGDSRSTYSGTVPSGNAVYYPKSTGAVLTSLSQMWWKRVLNYFGMTLVVNDSYSGGFVANKDGGNGANILSSDTAINNLGTTAPDIILIFAGVNDWNNDQVSIGSYDGNGAFPSTNTTFREAYALMLSKVQKKFPGTDIWLCTNPYCCPAGTGSTASNMPVPNTPSGVSLASFNDAIRDMAGIFGCGIIDFAMCGVNWGNLVTYTGDYTTDNGLHYNADGHELLAGVAISALSAYYNH